MIYFISGKEKCTYTDAPFILCKANKVAVDVRDLVRSAIETLSSGRGITLNLGSSAKKKFGINYHKPIGCFVGSFFA